MSKYPLIVSVVLWLMLAVMPARAVMTIDITQGVEGALPIAVVPFGWEGKGDAAPEPVGRIVAADLYRSGLFAPIGEGNLVSRPTRGEDVNFQDWRVLGVDNLIVGLVRENGPGSYEIRFQLFDVLKGQQLAGYSFPAGAGELRAVAHHIADLIYEKLTGVRGAFSTRIAYVVAEESAVAGGKTTGRYSLIVADSDGHGQQTVLESSEPLMSPAWSPDASRLAYVSFEKGQSEIYVQELATGRREAVATYPGINGAPAWSPDGSKLALTLSKDGNPEIYVLDRPSKRLTRITNSRSIDTEPTWSPDGRTLAFTSDRGGKPQIYRVSANGGRPERLTFDGEYNSRPVFAPDGRRIVMVHGNKGRYRIGVLDLESGYLRELSDGRLDESPSFAPNGAMVLYATRAGASGVLAGVSIDGSVKQRLRLDAGDVREPAWSPFLP
ncbi:MAG: Tol-Pal system beta propeller repeat protein TolB [Gammaproteobacteria bacterium]